MSVGLTQNAFTDKNILYRYQELDIDEDKVVTHTYISLSVFQLHEDSGNEYLGISGSKEEDTRDARPHLGPIFFIFMHFSAKSLSNNRFLTQT